MLVELYSPAFIEKGKVRPVIKFHKGLNVVLGKEDGANSIGKTSTLLAIDFAFGGDTYLKSSGVKHEGHHTIFFAFEFGGEIHRFARSTSDGDRFFVCDARYNILGPFKTKAEFTDWLKEQYKIAYDGLQFRVAVSSFFRIYGKSNLDERNPLRGTPGQNMDKSITTLVTLYDRYKDIEAYKKKMSEEDEKLKVYRSARKYHFISDLVGGRTKYEANLAEISQLESDLAMLTEEAEKGHTEEDIEKGQKKAQLTSEKLMIETEIGKKQRKLRLVDMGLEYGLYPTEADLASLQEYFPEVNLKKLYEVEKYHQKIAKILGDEFGAEQERLNGEISELESRRKMVDAEIRNLGYIGNISKEFLDHHAEIKGKIDALADQNEAFLMQEQLQDAKKAASDALKHAIEQILMDIEDTINGLMKEYDATLFAESRKPPRLHFNAYNSYLFETPDDTGTGSNYKSMIIYDLAVLASTNLPALAHDSLLLKNISDGSIDGIMRLYEKCEKQVFIAFDKQAAYSKETQAILESHKVIKLSDNNCELYGRSWNIEEK